MGSSIDFKNISYIPFEEAEKPRDGEVLTDRWWVVDPEKGLLVWKGRSYQCNRNKEIADSLQTKLYPNLEIRHMPVVYTGQHEEVY